MLVLFLISSIPRSIPRSIPHSIPLFPVPRFKDSPLSVCVRIVCSQLVDNLLTVCWQLATRLLTQHTCFKFFKQLFIVPQFINLLRCEWQPCSNLINEMTTLLQLVDKSVTNTCRSIVYIQGSRLEISPWYLYSSLLVQWSRDKAFDSLDGEYFSHNILDRQYTIAGLQKVSLPPLLSLNLKSSLHRFLYVVYYRFHHYRAAEGGQPAVIRVTK
jgi:hypothetical protein